MRIGIPLSSTRINPGMTWKPRNSQITLCQQVEQRELWIVGDYLEVGEEDGGLEQGGGAEPGRDGEVGLARDRQPRGGHGLVPGAASGEHRHAPIRRGRQTSGDGGEVPGASVWRIGHWHELGSLSVKVGREKRERGWCDWWWFLMRWWEGQLGKVTSPGTCGSVGRPRQLLT
jgi:hypothetical protein